jgi:hypothetical protein
MPHVSRPQRGRSLSMQEYDIPMRQRMLSAQLSIPPIIEEKQPFHPLKFQRSKLPITREFSEPVMPMRSLSESESEPLKKLSD